MTIEDELKRFKEEWNNDSPLIEVHTSGSTGTPKRMLVKKQQMMNSARITCDFLGLKPGDKALLCMPLRYIAGKMMVVRSLVAHLDLLAVEPSGHPLATIETPLRFAAMIPMQVYNSLQVPEERRRLEQIETLIIGGGAIDAALERELRQLPGRIYSTYGMTETLSHIALRRLNGPEASLYYTPFPEVHLSLSEHDTLVIDAPAVSDKTLVTNDIAELLPNGTFRIIGRKDNMIVSGGIKMQIESMENLLRSNISFNFAITAVPDPKFGEAVVLLVESAGQTIDVSESTRQQWFARLPKYQHPKQVIVVDAIPLTETGKIDRASCRLLAGKRMKEEAYHTLNSIRNEKNLDNCCAITVSHLRRKLCLR